MNNKGYKMIKTKKKTVKLTEDALQDQTMAPVAAQPATDTEVADASAQVDPAMTAEGEVPAEGEVDTNAPVETFEPPMPGMVPSGWINPVELGQAVAQATGDVQAAETAGDVQAAEGADTTAAVAGDKVVAGEQPLVAPQAQTESLHITKEELEMILEYRKYKANKLKEEVENPSEEAHIEDETTDMGAGAPEVAKTVEPGAEPIQESEEVCPDCGKNPCECKAKVHEAAELPLAPTGDEEEEVLTDEDSEKVEDSDEEDSEEVVPEEAEDEESEEEEVVDGDKYDMDSEVEDEESDDDLLARISSYLDGEDEEADLAADVLEDTADFLDSLFDEDDEEDEEDSEEEDLDDEDSESEEDLDDVLDEDDYEEESEEDPEIEEVEEDGFEDDDEDEDVESPFDEPESLPERLVKKSNKARKMDEDLDFNGIIYPSGSEAPVKESHKRRERYEDNDNLVEAYKKISAKKREALNSYRQALNGTTKVHESEKSDPNAWSNNRFSEKYEERQKFDYKELLKNGFLG